NREFLSVAISPDGKLLATGSGTRDEEKSRPGLVRLWNAITGQLRVILKGHPGAVAGVAFSPDGKVLASYGPEGTIKRWDLASFRELSSTKIRTKRLLFIWFRKDGTLLAIAGKQQGVLAIVDARTGKQLGKIEGPIRAIGSLAISADGRFLAGESAK